MTSADPTSADPLDWSTGFDAAISSLAATAPTAMALPVSWCPGWTVVDVIDHVAAVVSWATALIQVAPDGWVRRSEIDRRPDHADPTDWLADAAHAAHRAVDGADPTMSVRTWKGGGTVAWWQRRLTNEVTVHAWDVAAASGSVFVIASAIAIDAIDETFELFAPGPAADPGLIDRTVHLHATDAEHDGDGEWLIDFDAEGLLVRHEHAKGDVAARGPARALLLRLWGRPWDVTGDDLAGDTVQVFGDEALLDAMAAAVSR